MRDSQAARPLGEGEDGRLHLRQRLRLRARRPPPPAAAPTLGVPDEVGSYEGGGETGQAWLQQQRTQRRHSVGGKEGVGCRGTASHGEVEKDGRRERALGRRAGRGKVEGEGNESWVS